MAEQRVLNSSRIQMLRDRLEQKRQQGHADNTGAPRVTDAQRAVWVQDQLHDQGPALVTSKAWRINGSLNIDALRQAVNAVASYQDALRMRIENQDGEPVPIFVDEHSVTLDIVRPSEEVENLETWLERRLKELVITPFDLESGPLFRFHLFSLSDAEHVLLVTGHHIVSDDWSLGIIARDLSAFYAEMISGISASALPTRTTFKAFLSQTKQPVDPPDVSPTSLNWPVSGARVSASANDPVSVKIGVSIQGVVLEKLRVIARQHHLTVFSVLTATYQIALSRLCDQSELTVGVAYSDRISSDLENTVGMFVHLAGFDVDLSQNPYLTAMAGNVGKKLGPLLTGSMPLSPVGLESTIVYYNTPELKLSLPSASIEPQNLQNRGIPVDMHVGIRDLQDGLSLEFLAREGLFEAPLLKSFANVFVAILEAFVEDPAIRADDVPLLGESAQAVVAKHAVCNADYPSDLDISSLFQSMVQKYPDRPALTTPACQMTYRQLDETAKRFSHWLKARGIRTGDVIGLILPRGANLIVATLGSLKAGVSVAPLDPEYPDHGLQEMIETANCELILGTNSGGDDRFTHRTITPMPLTKELKAYDKETNGSAPLDPLACAYVMFTSGSTGRPKGVITTHRSIVRLAVHLPGTGISSRHRVAQLASPSFDGAFIEIWGALLNGAELVSPEGPIGGVRTVGDFIRQNRINAAFLGTGLFHLLADEDLEAFASLKWLAAGGEAMSPLHAGKVRAAYPELEFHNVYGPSENGALTTSFDVQRFKGWNVPIGKPLPNNIAFVLTRNRKLAPIGFAGELCVGGDGLALGYCNNPAATKEKFLRYRAQDLDLHPSGNEEVVLYHTGDRARYLSDGSIEFLGRIDEQVKFNGYRIEPMEIAHAIEELPGVVSSAVISIRSSPDSQVTALAAFFEADPAAVSEADVRQHLGRRLTRFLRPTHFVCVREMPLTKNGKIDRSALKDLLEKQSNRPSGGVTGIDKRLLEIWARLLKTRIDDQHADFFGLGGHSLLAMRMLAQVERTFRCTLDVSSFLQDPRLLTLQNRIQKPVGINLSSHAHVVLLRQGDPELDPIVFVMGIAGECSWSREIVESYSGRQAILGLRFGDQRNWDNEPATLEELSEKLVTDLTSVLQRRSLNLVGFSFGGFLAHIVAGQFQRSGGSLGRVVMLDPGLKFSSIGPGNPNKEGRYPNNLLKRLRENHQLACAGFSIDYIQCKRAFPTPRLNDGDAWAIFTSGEVRVYELDTYHRNIVYGEWAKFAAKLIKKIIEGTEPVERIFRSKLANFGTDLLHKANRARQERRYNEAIQSYRALLKIMGTPPAWLCSALAESYIQSANLMGLRMWVLEMSLKRLANPEAWCSVGSAAFNAGLYRTAMHCFSRSIAYSGGLMTGGYGLALTLIRLGRLTKAEGLAERMIRSTHSVPDGWLVKVIVEEFRQNEENAVPYIDIATRRTDAGVNHYLLASEFTCMEKRPSLALAMVNRGLSIFPNEECLLERQEYFKNRVELDK